MCCRNIENLKIRRNEDSKFKEETVLKVEDTSQYDVLLS